jgi:DNA-directed RNA polymerase specialized sigma24 family protein
VDITERDPFVWLVPRLSNDEEAYQAYAARLMSDLKCYFAGNRCEEAEDLAAEVLVRLIRKLESAERPECDSEESRKKYMFGIARNVLREWRRGPGVREVGLPESEAREPSLPPFDMAAKECLELLAAVVKQNLALMGPMERDTLLQSELNPDYSPTLARLAEEKGTTATAMRQRVHRARTRFRGLLLSSDHLGDLLRCLGIKRGAA